jgi:PKD domain protein
MKYRSIIIAGLLIILFSSCLKENAIPISSSFSIEVAEDKTAPVIIKLQNDSYGADEYEWTFEGESQVVNEGSILSMRFI